MPDLTSFLQDSKVARAFFQIHLEHPGAETREREREREREKNDPYSPYI
jgi:hypothetical protein